MTARATPPFMAADTYAGDELPGGRVSAFFPYAADFKLAPFWLPFGVRPSKDGVTVTGDSRFVATYGFRRVETPPKPRRRAHHHQLSVADRGGSALVDG